jgi:alcohol dehydrogenase (NADP+)
MKLLKFKNNDTMPILGLGTWKSGPNETYTAVREAIKAGYRHIDCAAIYGNEKEIGSAFNDAFKAGDVKREDLWVTSKLWNNAHQKDDVVNALQQSLKDLQLEYLDLYLVHWPVTLKPEIVFPGAGSDFLSPEELPVSQTWEGMCSCVEQKIARHIGVSNFSIKKLQELADASDHAPEMNQIELHPFLQQPQMLEFCKNNNIHLTAYAPLGSSDRPDELKQANEPGLLENHVIKSIADINNCSTAQILIAWAIKRGTAVIPKSVHKERLKENIASIDVQLSGKDMDALSELDRHFRYVTGDFWIMPGSPYTLENLWNE